MKSPGAIERTLGWVDDRTGLVAVTEHAMFHPGRLRHACTQAVSPKAH